MSGTADTSASYKDGPLPWERHKRPALGKLFNRAAHYAPALAGAKLLGVGSFGMVAGHDDGSVSKITFRFIDPDMNGEAKRSAAGEVNTLRLLDGFAGRLGSFHVPVLLGEPNELPEDSPFLHIFRMTHVSGVAGDWYPLTPVPAAERQAYFRDAGAVLAQFHAAVADLRMPVRLQGDGWRIRPVAHLSDRINEGLMAAARYVDGHAMAGNIHGDFHGGNLMHDADGRITGIIDFAMTGRSANLHSDMLAVPDGYLDKFIEGYEGAGGAKVDRHVVTAASLGWMSRLAHFTQDDPAAQTDVTEKINETLNRLTFVTGYKP